MKFVYFFLALSLLLAACSSAHQTAAPSVPSSSSSPLLTEPATTVTTPSLDVNQLSPKTPESEGQPSSTEGLVRIDEQGAVSVEVTPVNLTNPGKALEFEVGLNTHSIDLSMDLSALATLSTDSGKIVQANQWKAPSGGHHVSGKLVFPMTVEGQPFLEGAKKLTLTIKNLDAPERVFSWDLSS